MPNRKPAHSGKGANTPTQSPTPTETSQPPRFYRVIAYSSAGDVGGIHHGKPHKQPEAYASRYEALQAGSELLHADSSLYAFELERSATVASQHTSQLDRRAWLDVECTISTALQRLECFAELMADMLVNMPADAGANALYSLLWAIEEQARAITEANHAITAIRTGGQS